MISPTPEHGRYRTVAIAIVCATMVLLVALTPPPDRANVVTALMPAVLKVLTTFRNGGSTKRSLG
ncbi:hypothetical protein [Curtobacterium sp. Leaf261]|uniref:hypothetical protein n=1 Tax=Curtobacterium sp. Leaf261 TaxID=1736311 RepID=UPI000A5EE761|nr:hypothetical protein [Curtobacterium sp. Leaf261]